MGDVLFNNHPSNEGGLGTLSLVLPPVFISPSILEDSKVKSAARLKVWRILTLLGFGASYHDAIGNLAPNRARPHRERHNCHVSRANVREFFQTLKESAKPAE